MERITRSRVRRSMRALAPTLVLLVVLAWPGALSAQGARLIARDHEGTWTTGPVQARVGESVEVRAAIVDADGTLLADVDAIRWEGRTRRPHGPLPAGAIVRFSRIEPRMEHVDRPSPNPGIPAFSNAVLTGPDHGDWIGFDALEYVESALASGRGVEVGEDRIALSAAHPLDAGRDRHGGAGSVWLAAEVTLPGGEVVRAPDATRVDRFGLRAEVMRVSFREADDFVGWLSTYFNVPNVFGSSGRGRDHQADRYVGADCADVLVGARRAMGGALPYVSVAGIGTVARPVSEVLRQREDGVIVDATGAEARLAWGRDVLRGDLVAIDYVEAGDRTPQLPRAWDHIGALVRDDGDGALDGGDVLRHMTHRGLDDRGLIREGHIRIRIWRLR